MKQRKIRRWHLGGAALVLLSVTVLTALSLICLFAIYYNDQTAGQHIFNPWYQVIYILLGVMLMLFMARFNLGLLERAAVWLYTAAIVLLISLNFFGTTVNGATRWFDLGAFRFQPAELAKLAVILLLARLLARRAQTIRPGTVILAAVYTLIPAALIVIQPDLGSAVMFVAIWVGMLTVTPIHRGILAVIIAAGIGLTVLSLPLLADYQRARITSFLNPASDPLGTGYNARQAMIAVGSGQLSGRGLDGGSQSQLNFLPSQHTDFIFAVVAEKLGFIGSVLIILGFITLSGGMIVLARQTAHLFGAYLTAGVISLISFQGLINIAMNLGIAPVTGIPLPFVSYGGTHVLVNFVAIGMVLGAHRASRSLGFHR